MRQQYFHAPELPLGFARIVNLLEGTKERDPVNQTYFCLVGYAAHRLTSYRPKNRCRGHNLSLDIYK
jgi:hypothetical protein